MNQLLLQVEHLSLRFRGQTTNALNDISFTIKQGEVVGVAGESGSGKSLTSMAIMGLLPVGAELSPESSILFQSAHQSSSLIGLSQKAYQQIRGAEIGMIFQEPMSSLNPVMTCGKQVAEVLLRHKKMSKEEARRETRTLFDKVKLPRAEQMLDAYPHQLSGGQKQRVMIAMAIACKPSLLIADEPTTALDVTVQATIIDLLDELRKEMNMGVLFISHDLGLMSDFADRVNILYRGSLLETGDARRVFQNPEHPYTRGLLASLPRGTRTKKLPTVHDFMPGPPSAEVLMPEKPEERRFRLKQIEESEWLLELRNLSVTYSSSQGRTIKAVDDISLSIHEGESLGLVGESGSGKSTIGRAILGLTPISGGEILLRGENLVDRWKNKDAGLRKKMQLVFQDPYSALHPGMRIGEALMEPMLVHGMFKTERERRERAIYLLNKTGLHPDAFKKYPHEFSGGQRQRVVIARALALEPEFMVLDESVSALDVSVQAQILNLLKDLRDEFRLTYLFISHDLSVIQYFCDRIAVLQSGKLVEIQEADQLIKNPADRYTQTLIAAIPDRKTIFNIQP
jgi:peptide/nickel transport system ATP-binding protein